MKRHSMKRRAMTLLIYLIFGPPIGGVALLGYFLLVENIKHARLGRGIFMPGEDAWEFLYESTKLVIASYIPGSASALLVGVAAAVTIHTPWRGVVHVALSAILVSILFLVVICGIAGPCERIPSYADIVFATHIGAALGCWFITFKLFKGGAR